MKATRWLTEGTPEKIVLDALQRIAFEGVDDPVEVALEALHGAGFASINTTYNGHFDLGWLAPGEKAMSAGDGTGDALIVGEEYVVRLKIGDAIRLDRGRAALAAHRDKQMKENA